MLLLFVSVEEEQENADPGSSGFGNPTHVSGQDDKHAVKDLLAHITKGAGFGQSSSMPEHVTARLRAAKIRAEEAVKAKCISVGRLSELIQCSATTTESSAPGVQSSNLDPSVGRIRARGPFSSSQGSFVVVSIPIERVGDESVCISDQLGCFFFHGTP